MIYKLIICNHYVCNNLKVLGGGGGEVGGDHPLKQYNFATNLYVSFKADHISRSNAQSFASSKKQFCDN